MIRVLHVISSLDMGGAEVLLADLVERSDRSRFSHEVVSLLPGGAVRPRVERTGIKVSDLNMRHDRPSLAALLRLRRMVRQSGAQVVHGWMYHACLAAALASRNGQRSRLVWGLHAANLDVSRYPIMTRLATAACRFLSSVPAAIVVNSGETRESHERSGYNPRRWVLIPNGIDTKRFQPDAAARQAVRHSLGIPHDAPLIGFIARRDPQKDHVTVLRAAARLHERLPATHFVFAGIGTDDAQMRALIEAHAPAPRASIHCLGVRNDVPAITAALDVATMCSAHGESFSNVVAEAMACAVPCVVTDVAPLPELLGDAGLVVRVGDDEGLAAAWESLLREPADARRARGARGRERIEVEFSADLMVRRFEALYQGVS